MLDDIDHLLDDAIALHEAKEFSLLQYLKILEHDALHADTNHNFGLLKVELGLKESINFSTNCNKCKSTYFNAGNIYTYSNKH